MSKNVLLARPHPFIVAEMKPFLEEDGYTISRLGALANLPTLAPKAGGAIIALALSSPLPESAETVFTQLRQVAPGVLMVACHNFDLNAARACGFRTAFVRRPHECGAEGPTDPVPHPDCGIVVDDFRCPRVKTDAVSRCDRRSSVKPRQCKKSATRGD